MEKQKTNYQYEDFFDEVNHDDREFITSIHQTLLQDGYKPKTESKESGFIVTYTHLQTKGSIISFLFQEKGLFARIYADNLSKYASFLNSLPEKMVKTIDRAKACKQLLNPNQRTWKCVGGYDFFIRDNFYQKCRYRCFQFEIDQENKPVLADFIENERKERAGLLSQQ